LLTAHSPEAAIATSSWPLEESSLLQRRTPVELIIEYNKPAGRTRAQMPKVMKTEKFCRPGCGSRKRPAPIIPYPIAGLPCDRCTSFMLLQNTDDLFVCKTIAPHSLVLSFALIPKNWTVFD
jgi:hypothetical protein